MASPYNTIGPSRSTLIGKPVQPNIYHCGNIISLYPEAKSVVFLTIVLGLAIKCNANTLCCLRELCGLPDITAWTVYAAICGLRSNDWTQWAI